MLLNDRHYVCLHKPAKQHADTSFTQVNDPLTGQLYFPSQSIWSAQPRCWPRPVDKSAPHSPEPLTAIDPGQLKKNWLSQTIMNRTQAIAHGFPACEIELAINRA